MSDHRSEGGEVRFGLIGCGEMGNVRAAAIADGMHRLVAVSDADAKRSARLGAKYEAVNDRDWRTMLHRDVVDAVVISAPVPVHSGMAIAALEAGKHVLCERPLAGSAADCRAMVAAANRADRVLATGFHYRFHPPFQRVRELLAAGAIGELSHLRGYAGKAAMAPGAAVAGDGALRGVGSDLIDLARNFLGEVVEATGFATGGEKDHADVEDNGFLLMRSPAGRVAMLHASLTEWEHDRFMIELIGTRGRLRASYFPMRVELLERRPDRPKARVRSFRFRARFADPGSWSRRRMLIQALGREIDAFARLIAGEASVVATGADGLRALEIAAAVSGPHDRDAKAIAPALSDAST